MTLLSLLSFISLISNLYFWTRVIVITIITSFLFKICLMVQKVLVGHEESKSVVLPSSWGQWWCRYFLNNSVSNTGCLKQWETMRRWAQIHLHYCIVQLYRENNESLFSVGTSQSESINCTLMSKRLSHSPKTNVLFLQV